MKAQTLNSKHTTTEQSKTEIVLKKKVLILDGAATGEEKLSSILSLLTDVLKQNGADVEVISPRNMKLAHCIGCFGCWLETPGTCRFKEPDAQETLKAWIQSDTVVMLTPVTFGGYSSRLKQAVERNLPTLLPYFSTYHGEIHHRARYSKNPRLIGIGVQDSPNDAEADIFKLVVGRHAIDMHAPSFAAEVIGINDSIDHLREAFQSLLLRSDPPPWAKRMKQLAPEAEMIVNHSEPSAPQRACLIIGSPKTLSNSTSGVLGNYILDRMKEHGWETESVTLKPSLSTSQGETELLKEVDQADLLVFAFPLYVEALPFLMTRALEVIANHRRVNAQPRPLQLFAIVNNGFPESYQNKLALSICRNFAKSTGMTWVGGLPMGAGESVIGGEPLKQRSDLGFPLYKIQLALKTAADALAQGRPIPIEAIRNLASSPVPYTPFFVWRFLFTRGSIGFWEKRATGHGVSKQRMLASPVPIN